MDSDVFDVNNVSISTGITTGSATNCIGGLSYGYPSWSWSGPDKGTQAYNIIKALVNKKLVECKSASQFMTLMDEVIKAL
jgi:hypothetical protein